MNTAESQESWVKKSRNYFVESVDELKKVTTPTRPQTVQATIVTLIIMLFVAVCLFILDMIFSRLMESLVG